MMKQQWIKLTAILLSVSLLTTFTACDTVPMSGSTENVENTTHPETTTVSMETSSPLETTTAMTTTETENTSETTTAETTTPMPFAAEIAQAIDISGEWPEKTLEVPLLVLLVSFDADGDGENDYDENDPTKLYRNKKDACYGEQWAGTNPEDHYENLFGENNSLSALMLENSMGYFHYYPTQFDKAPENADPRGGIMSVTINLPHTASEKYGSRKTWTDRFPSNYVRAALKECDPYIDFSKYDTNKDGRLSCYELGIVFIVSGQNHGKDKNGKTTVDCDIVETSSRFRYASGGGFAYDCFVSCDGVTPDHFVYQAEYERIGTIRSYHHSGHELLHTFGAIDLYDNSNEPINGWPTAYRLSGEHSAGYCYLDPYHRIRLGWVEERIVEDGIYTLHSTHSKEYAVLRVNTPNPDEYYLIEVRTPVDCEKTLSDKNHFIATNGGIMVWHIDESGVTYINSEPTGMSFCFSRDPRTGEPLHPVVSPLMAEGYNTEKTLITNTNPGDPFYWGYGNTAGVCNTGDFKSFITGNQSMYNYPSDWKGEKDFNIKIEILSAPGDDMTVRITGVEQPKEPKVYPPLPTELN